MKKVSILILVLALGVGLVSVADAAGRGASAKRTEAAAAGLDMDSASARNGGMRRLPAPRVVGGATSLLPGTIQYDNGVVSGGAAPNGFCVGNQFDTAATNPLTASGSITNLSVYMVAVGGGAAFVSFFDQQAATAANPVTSFSTSMVAGFNAKAVTVNYVGNTFLAGVWNWTAGSDTLGIATGTTGGQGFHGMTINDIAGTGFVRPGTFNGVVRATGDVIAIPVELTGFEVVDE